MLFWIIFFAILLFVYGLYLKKHAEGLITAAYIRGEGAVKVNYMPDSLSRIYNFLRPIMPGQQSMNWVSAKIIMARLPYLPEQIWTLTYVCAFLFAGLAFLWGYATFTDKSILLVISLIGGILGWVFPLYYVHSYARKAVARRERELLPLIQQLKILAKSGVGTNFDALASVVLEDEDGILSRDIKEALHQGVQTGDRRQALLDMAQRCGSRTVKEVIELIIEAETKEIPLYDVLEGVETSLLNEIEVKANDAQSKAEDRMAIPLAAMLLPANMLIMIGPGLINAKALLNF